MTGADRFDDERRPFTVVDGGRRVGEQPDTHGGAAVRSSFRETNLVAAGWLAGWLLELLQGPGFDRTYVFACRSTTQSQQHEQGINEAASFKSI